MYLVNNTKFWEIELKTNKVIIRYGKLNQDDQEQNVQTIEKAFDNQIDAQEYLNESLTIKLSKGYQEIKKQQKPKTNNYQINVNTVQSKQPSRNINSQSSNHLSLADLTNQAVSKFSPSKASPSKDLGKPCSNHFPVLLAETWSEEVDPTGWLMSEKLDGMRMIWTGSTMYSRNGNRIFFPKFFVENWPKSQFDGELWLERDSFQKLVSITKKHIPDEEAWRKVKYMVFDVPGLNLPFEQRYERFSSVIDEIQNDHLIYVPHIVCRGMDHLLEELGKVEEKGGEGLMIRNPNSHYEGRRSKTLLKVKTFQDDEATVLGHEEGTGRCQGMVGALRVINTSNIEFKIGSGLNDDIRRRPPKIGSVITYKYYGTSKRGVPRFPIYMRERPKE